MAKAGQKGNAKQRAYFAWRDRLDGKTPRSKKARSDDKAQADEQLKAQQARKAETAKATQARRDEARRKEFSAVRARQEDDRRKAANTKEAFNRNAQDRRAADNVRAETQRRAQAVQYERKQRQQKEQERRDALSADERKKLARNIRHQRQAKRDVRQEDRDARANMIFRQRQETSELRAAHKGQRQGIKAEIAGHERDYLHKIGEIDVKERRTLSAFDTRRGTIRGRLDEMRRGKSTLDEERRNLEIGFDLQRSGVSHKLETLKDRLMQDEYRKPIKQALERKEMMEDHAHELRDQQWRHERTRPERVEKRKLSYDQAYERGQQQRQEAKQDREAGLSMKFNR